MKSRHIRAIACTALLCACALRAPADTTRGDQLLATDALRTQAMVAGDFPLLERVLADDLSYVHSNGLVAGKAALLAALRAHQIRYLSITTGDVAARDYGCTGVVTGSAMLEVEAGGRPATLALRYTATYVLRDRRWQLAAYQSTTVTPVGP